MNPAAPRQHNRMLRYRRIETYSDNDGFSWMPLLAAGSFTNFQSRALITNPGMADRKNADRQPHRSATWVVSTAAAARPTSAAALTTKPMFRPRRSDGEDSSMSAVMVDQVGPPAAPIKARTSSN